MFELSGVPKARPLEERDRPLHANALSNRSEGYLMNF
jgi:hypothetical protein